MGIGESQGFPPSESGPNEHLATPSEQFLAITTEIVAGRTRKIENLLGAIPGNVDIFSAYISFDPQAFEQETDAAELWASAEGSVTNHEIVQAQSTMPDKPDAILLVKDRGTLWTQVPDQPKGGYRHIEYLQVTGNNGIGRIQFDFPYPFEVVAQDSALLALYAEAFEAAVSQATILAPDDANDIIAKLKELAELFKGQNGAHYIEPSRVAVE